jgi:hypothetical protein
MPGRKPGRPRKPGERKFPTSFYTTETTVTRLQELGHGNVSAGIERALENSDLWLAHVGDPMAPATPPRQRIDDDPSREG